MTTPRSATQSSSASQQTRVSITFLCAVVALLLWSGTAIANKIAVVDMDGLTVGVLRSMLAGFIAIGIAFLFKLPFPHARKDQSLLVVSGLCSFVIWPVLLSSGIEFTSASHAALIMAMIPIFTVLISCTITRQVPRSGWWYGACLALAATVVLVVDRENWTQVNRSGMKGDLLVLAGCIVCSMGYVAGGRLSPKIGTVATTFWGLSIALPVLVPIFFFISENTHWQLVSTHTWFAIGWMTLLSSLLGYALWFYALGAGGIAKISALQLIMPVITLFAAAMILNESLSLKLVFICAVIVSGTFIAHRSA